MTALPHKRSHSRATVFLTVASLLSLTVLLVGIALPAGNRPPAVEWRVGDDQRKVAQFAPMPGGTPIALTIELTFPAHVYVASWSTIQGTIALFPSERLGTDMKNPLPAGRHALPGILDGKPMTWPAHSVLAPIYYLVVASREPLTELEQTLKRVRQMGHMARPGSGFVDRGMYVFAPEGGMKSTPPLTAPAGAELDAARTAFADLPGLDSDGPMRELPDRPGVFVRPFVVQGQ